MPVAARVVRVPARRGAPLSLALPLGGGAAAPGLALLLLNPFGGDSDWEHRYHVSMGEREAADAVPPGLRPRPPDTCQLALAAALTAGPCRRGRAGAGDGGGGGGAAAGDGSRVLEPSVAAAKAFRVVPSGTRLGFSVVPLDGLLRGGGGGGGGEGAAPLEVRRHWGASGWR